MLIEFTFHSLGTGKKLCKKGVHALGEIPFLACLHQPLIFSVKNVKWICFFWQQELLVFFPPDYQHLHIKRTWSIHKKNAESQSQHQNSSSSVSSSLMKTESSLGLICLYTCIQLSTLSHISSVYEKFSYCTFFIRVDPKVLLTYVCRY